MTIEESAQNWKDRTAVILVAIYRDAESCDLNEDPTGTRVEFTYMVQPRNEVA